MTKFHDKLMGLIDYWFNGTEPDENILRMVDYIGGSGWNGSEEQTRTFELEQIGAVNKLQGNVRLRYLLSVAFMGIDVLHKRYPINFSNFS